MGGSAYAEPLKIHLAIIDIGTPYQRFAKTFKDAIEASDVDIMESHGVNQGKAGLTVAVGMHAARQAVLQCDAPMLLTMISSSEYRDLMAKDAISDNPCGQMISAIYLDQPMNRTFDFIKKILPNRSRVGVLYSAEENIDFSAMRKMAAEKGLSLITQRVDEDQFYSALEEVLSASDLLMAMPGGVIYNSSNIRNILLTSYNHSVPLIGLSKHYVRAGALSAILTTPEQLANQTAEAILSFRHKKQLASPQYPIDFEIKFNREVGRSLGISFPSKVVIRTHLSVGHHK